MAADGDAGLVKAVTGAFDLVVVDLLLPKMSGFLLCSRLRDVGIWSPVLVLTAKTGEWDEAEALDSGADDFLTQACLSDRAGGARQSALAPEPAASAPGTSRMGICVSTSSATNAAVGARTVDLSARETEVLAHLMLRQGEVISKRDLMLAVWGTDFPGDPNIVEVYVRHLRKKLGRPPGGPRHRDRLGFRLPTGSSERSMKGDRRAPLVPLDPVQDHSSRCADRRCRRRRRIHLLGAIGTQQSAVPDRRDPLRRRSIRQARDGRTSVPPTEISKGPVWAAVDFRTAALSARARIWTGAVLSLASPALAPRADSSPSTHATTGHSGSSS